MSIPRHLRARLNTEEAKGILNVVLRHLIHGRSWLIDETKCMLNLPLCSDEAV